MHIDPALPYVVATLLSILLVSIFLKYIRQPHVVAYLAVGIILGPHGIALIESQESLTRLGSFGVVLLMFFIGMEISPRRLAQNWKISVIGTFIQIIVSIGVVWLLGSWLDWTLSRIILLGFVISLSSTAVVLKLLQDWKELDTDTGQNALGILLVQDLAIVPMLIIVGQMSGESLSIGTLTLQIVGGICLVALATFLALKDQLRIPALSWLGKDHETQVFTAAVLCFGFALITGLMQLSTALGAFIAGMFVATAKETHWVHQALEPFRVIFIALFFVSIGMLLDIDFFMERWWKITTLVIAILLLNTLITAIILKGLGESWRSSLYGGTLLSQIGEFSFVLAAAGLHSMVINDTGYQYAVAVITLSLVFCPMWIMFMKRALFRAHPHPIGQNEDSRTLRKHS
jgi:K+:H+ antiporter